MTGPLEVRRRSARQSSARVGTQVTISFGALPRSREWRPIARPGSATLICVQLEYLNDRGSAARPVLLVYGKSPTDATALQRAIEVLAAGDAVEVQIDALPGFEGVNGCALTAQQSSRM